MYIYTHTYTQSFSFFCFSSQRLGFVPAEVETAPIAVALEAALPISVYVCVYDDMFTSERHLPSPGQRGHSPQRHTAAGTAAPTTTDTGNTVLYTHTRVSYGLARHSVLQRLGFVPVEVGDFIHIYTSLYSLCMHR